jgi:hypothetical protein
VRRPATGRGTIESAFSPAYAGACRERLSQENHTIEAVIAALSAAPRGNRELDCMIACALGTAGGEFDQIMMRELVSEGFAWDSIVELWDDRVPAYTSSLDAALDEENIRCVIHSSKRGRWAAIQKAPDGREVLMWGADEVLARRLAALKALSVNLAAAAAATAMPGAKQAGSPAAPDQADEPQAPEQETKEWSILF